MRACTQQRRLAAAAPASQVAGLLAPRLRRWPDCQSLARAVSMDQQAAIQTNQEVPPPGCSRYTVELKKPLGLVLEQLKSGGAIIVAEISPDGNADRAGVGVGDQLIATSGVTYTSEDDYNGATVKKGMKVVRLTVQNESFGTVRAAIGSHPGHMAVTLELQRCSAPPTSSSEE